MIKPPPDIRKFSSFVSIVRSLRSKKGCPWDREQTHDSLVPFVVEEVFELVDAIENGDANELKEELGDVLLQVVLHAQLATEKRMFSIDDVVESISAKMIRRHPHVFGHVKAIDSKEVKKNWEKIKGEEKKNKRHDRSPFHIPPALPALQRAQKIGKKTGHVGFDWSSSAEVMAKVDEELVELKNVMDCSKPSTTIKKKSSHTVSKRKQQQEDEIGDLLFSITQLARHLRIDAEQALRKTNRRFEKRYTKMLA